ncbi:PTS system N,N'-diacetylchitobiose-specific transporter subunit IIC [Enterobacter asburiae]|uniref:PTS system N,N'-diacetylchitobiose-specific transporter subunit IIC n=1 Tax=Enterobacter asburiae TaxID=61645 RepID=A0A376F7C9_ENTAS|nr:PTS system N,N'-diacetylchitobiose-specific transporter subunit IIC [Enterobacter asburiae]
MSKVIASLEKVLLPFAVKIGKQPHVNAIKNGFIKLMPLTLAGAMFVLINNVFLSFGEGSFFYSLGIRLDASTIETLNGFKAIGGNVYNGTLGIMSLMAPFFIGMALAEERKVDPLAAGLLSVAAFMTVTPYSVGEAYAVGANWLGGANIISGIVIGLVVAEMFTFIIRRNWVIRLPDSVPASVSRFIFRVDSRLHYSLHHGDYRLGALPLGHKLPPDHHGLYLYAAGVDGWRGRLGVCDFHLSAVVLWRAWFTGTGRAGQRDYDPLGTGKTLRFTSSTAPLTRRLQRVKPSMCGRSRCLTPISSWAVPGRPWV